MEVNPMFERPNVQLEARSGLHRWGITGTVALCLLWATPVLAEEAGGGGLLSINPGLMIWTWFIFLLLVAILGRWAWGPILGALEARERRIQETLDQAARQREEAAKLLEEHGQLMDGARGQANEILVEGRKAAERLRADLLAEAKNQKRMIIDRARDEILRERDEALDTLRREAVDLSISAASRVLHKNLDSKANRRLVDEYLESLATEGEGGGAD